MSYYPAKARTYHLRDTASLISGYKRMVMLPQTVEAEATLTGASNSSAEVLIKAFSSDAVDVVSIPAGVWRFNLHAKVDSATDITKIKVYAYSRNLAGTETALFNVLSDEINDTTAALVTILSTSQAAFTVAETDRIIIKFYAVSDSGTDKTVTLYYQGVTNYSTVLIPDVIPVREGDMVKNTYDPDGDGYINRVAIGSILAGFTGVYDFVISSTNGGIILDRLNAIWEPFVRLTSANAGGGQMRGLVAGGLRFTDKDAAAEWARITAAGLSTALQIISTLAIGTAPLAVTSTTVNANLNADLLDGNHATAFELALTKGNMTATSPIAVDQTREVIGGAVIISHVGTAGNIHLPTDGASNQILKNSGASGTGAWGTVTESAGALGAITTLNMPVTSGGAIRGIFKATVTDNVATNVFRIATTNEAGNNDAGSYSVFVHALISHGVLPAIGSGAAKSFTAQFCRIMEGTGTGVNSMVSEVIETASAATSAAVRDIDTVTMTVLETSEYLNDVQFLVDATGSAVTTIAVTVVVDLIWLGFTTAPVMSQL